MSILTLATKPSRWDAEQILNDKVFITNNGAMQTEAHVGNRWRLVLTYLNLTGSRRATIWAFAFSLSGVRNRAQVNLSDIGYVRRGAGGGTPLLVGSHSSGLTALAIDGASTTVTNWLMAGDFITVGNELKMVTASCNTVAGATSIPIWPEMHKTHADNLPVEITSPKGVFYQAGPLAISGQPFPSDWLNESFVLTLEEDILA